MAIIHLILSYEQALLPWSSGVALLTCGHVGYTVFKWASVYTEIGRRAVILHIVKTNGTTSLPRWLTCSLERSNIPCVSICDALADNPDRVRSVCTIGDTSLLTLALRSRVFPVVFALYCCLVLRDRNGLMDILYAAAKRRGIPWAVDAAHLLIKCDVESLAFNYWSSRDVRDSVLGVCTVFDYPSGIGLLDAYDTIPNAIRRRHMEELRAFVGTHRSIVGKLCAMVFGVVSADDPMFSNVMIQGRFVDPLFAVSCASLNPDHRVLSAVFDLARAQLHQTSEIVQLLSLSSAHAATLAQWIPCLADAAMSEADLVSIVHAAARLSTSHQLNASRRRLPNVFTFNRMLVDENEPACSRPVIAHGFIIRAILKRGLQPFGETTDFRLAEALLFVCGDEALVKKLVGSLPQRVLCRLFMEAVFCGRVDIMRAIVDICMPTEYLPFSCEALAVVALGRRDVDCLSMRSPGWTLDGAERVVRFIGENVHRIVHPQLRTLCISDICEYVPLRLESVVTTAFSML